jgi:hypothetical protein
MAQVARNLTDAAAGALTGVRHLIVDRDPLYTAHFRSLLQTAGVQLLRLPSRSPNLKGCAERFVRSIKGRGLRSDLGPIRRPRCSRCRPSRGVTRIGEGDHFGGAHAE